MRLINSASFAATGTAALVTMPHPVSFDDGKKCDRLRAEVQIELTSTDAAPYNLTNADVLALCRKIWTNGTLQFGDQVADIVDGGLSFDLQRLQGWLMDGRDILVGKPGTVKMVELYNYPAGGENLTVPAVGGGTLTVTIEFTRPFLFESFGAEHVSDWCPGATQMRQAQWKFTSQAGTFTADAGKVTATGTAQVTYMSDEREADSDDWVAVPRLYQTNASSLEVKSPAGCLLGLAEVTATGFATVIDAFSVTQEGRPPVHQVIQAARVVADTINLIEEGDLNPQNLATILFMAGQSQKLKEFPLSNQFTFRAVKQDLATFQLVWLIAPMVSESYADDQVRRNVAHGDVGGKGKAVLAVNSMALHGREGGDKFAAVSPIALVTPADPQFELSPGRYWEGDKPSIVHVPEVVKKATAQAVKAVGAETAKATTIGAAQTAKVAALVPGATNASPTPTAKMTEIAKHLDPMWGGIGAPQLIRDLGAQLLRQG